MENARLMEQRLIEILKTKSKDVADLLEVEKELGRVREEIETMQGELRRFMDSQVAVRRGDRSAFREEQEHSRGDSSWKNAHSSRSTAPEVEKTYSESHQATRVAQSADHPFPKINRDNTRRVSSYVYLGDLAPGESEAMHLARERNGAAWRTSRYRPDASRKAETVSLRMRRPRRDKVVLNITISREERDQSLQQNSLHIRSSDVNDKTKQLRDLAEKQGSRIRSSSFSRDPNGREFANVSLRVPMKNYSALTHALNTLSGKVENVSVRRDAPPRLACQSS